MPFPTRYTTLHAPGRPLDGKRGRRWKPHTLVMISVRCAFMRIDWRRNRPMQSMPTLIRLAIIAFVAGQFRHLHDRWTQTVWRTNWRIPSNRAMLRRLCHFPSMRTELCPRTYRTIGRKRTGRHYTAIGFRSTPRSQREKKKPPSGSRAAGRQVLAMKLDHRENGGLGVLTRCSSKIKMLVQFRMDFEFKGDWAKESDKVDWRKRLCARCKGVEQQICTDPDR